MASLTKEQISSCHVVAIPHPGRGHISAMMNLCRLLLESNHDDSLLITFIVTEEWLGFIGGSEATPPNLRLRSIPNVIPSELVRGADLVAFIDAVHTEMEAPVEQLIERLEPPACFIVADTILQWAVDVGSRRNIPVASFWPMSVSAFSMVHHFGLVVSNGDYPIDIAERGDERVDYIPGISSIQLADISPPFNEKLESIRRRMQGAVSIVSRAKCLLIASFHELETHVTNILRAKLPLPVYTVGPTIPYLTLHNMPSQRPIGPGPQQDVNYYNWLNFQPMDSVLYVSFGSFMMTSGGQMDEIAIGLRASGARFLWVARNDTSRLQEMSGDMGLVVPWCDQLKVLCHCSVGGFLTHCGWNSIMESIFAGIVMLTFPLGGEQSINSKLIVEDWKIGIKLRTDEIIVKREDIARKVQRLMDLEGDESKGRRRRAKELHEACKRAIENGGSSHCNLNTFVGDVLQAYCS